MRKIQLGTQGPEVSSVCLGSMTWGRQNTPEQGHAQLDYAAERSVNFIDTAELYPVNPAQAETAGLTERIIGDGLAKRGDRHRWVIATKVSGYGQIGVRDGTPVTGALLHQTVDASLRRLRTDYIDLYQLHVPNRNHYHFRNIWGFRPTQDKAAIVDNMADCLAALAELRQAGKIREFGVSNESSWGLSQWLRLADQGIGPRPVSVQNEYSLLCRYFDTDLAELAVNEGITLLAYSPSAQGLLSGKHRADFTPTGSRREVSTHLGGRCNPNVWPAIEAYVALAKEQDVHPVTLAVAFVMSRYFPAIPIVGASGIEQLEKSLDAASLSLSEEVLQRIDSLFKQYPMPY